MNPEHSPPWGSAAPVAPATKPRDRYDVAVVGAGIVGLSTALALTERGADVVVLEAESIGFGVTAHSTAKLSALHEISYSKITSRAGAEAAQAYARLNLDGLELVRGWSVKHDIDCALHTAPAITYAERKLRARKIEREYEAAKAAGLPVELVDEIELPWEIEIGVRLGRQARFDPLAFLLGAAKSLRASSCEIHEGRRVTDLRRASNGVELPCEDGTTVRAGAAVIATHYPFTDRSLLFPRLIPARSYTVAAVVETSLAIEGMYLGTDHNTRSLRIYECPDGPVLLLGGEGHAVARSTESDSYRRLEEFWRERLGSHPIRWRWSAQDPSTPDGLPYIGRVVPWAPAAYLATGFGKWGLAAGAGAGELIARAITGGDESAMEPFKVSRLNLPRSLPTISEAGFKTVRGLVSDRVVARSRRDSLEPGQGAVVGAGLAQRAVYCDEDGADHVVSARCTHMGCIVRFNDAERSWDCPCHGSRFDIDGSVIEGPAVDPLKAYSVPGRVTR